MKEFKKMSEEVFNFNIANRDCGTGFYNRIDNDWRMNRYEFTVTYDPKRVYSIEYAQSLTQYVIEDIEKFCCRVKQSENNQMAYCYVVEYQQNGYPHLHGTVFQEVHIKPEQQVNFERLCRRKYGKTDMYATGPIDKVHRNDHFNGLWSDYLKKEGVVNYYFYKNN